MHVVSGSMTRLLTLSGLLLGLWLIHPQRPDPAVAAPPDFKRRVNVPDLTGQPFEPAIFWLGGVDPTRNYADVRMWYHATHLELAVHVIDRQLWYAPTPAPTDLQNWDAISLYLNIEGAEGSAPTRSSYHLVAQLGATDATDNYHASFRGNGSTWTETAVPYDATSSWRGAGGPNTYADNKGWQLSVAIPFASLGLTEAPPQGTVWGMAVVLHDRDDETDTPIADQAWPERADVVNPATWGELHFGRATYTVTTAVPAGSALIRNGLNGASVKDGHVGGHTTCGDGLDHWTEWGTANYAGYTQINVQNQWDISDYPCFSRYYVTFPLDAVPAGATILSASLNMTRFGNAGGGTWGTPPASYIHALTVAEAWNEANLTWNTAPLALENIAGTWVEPTQTSGQQVYRWDVTGAAAAALAEGAPLRLALYSIDGERHSGKYFWSSDTNDWDGTVRPALEITWGTACTAATAGCTLSYLPFVTE